ncbi:hypothetical protein [Alkalihalobacillus alcalophilus]|nr:hypothetical protein [Alkalihalobacillus alcalophilus]
MKRHDSNRNQLDHLANVQSINNDWFTTVTDLIIEREKSFSS